MTEKFGIEIEFYGLGNRPEDVASRLYMPDIAIAGESYNHHTRSYWKVVTDSSVRDGIELVSPPLMYNEYSLQDVTKVFDKIVEQGGFVENSCGFHVHIDARFLHDYSSTNQNRFFEFLVSSYQANEDVFERLVKPHRNNNSFCLSTKGKSWIDIRDNRYHRLNISSFLRHGTIEFRQFQGTLKAKTAIAWITLCMTFIRNARARFEAINPTIARESATRF